MRALFQLFCAVLRDRRGATAVEYGLILALVFLTIVGGITAVADGTISMWNNVHDKAGAVQ